MVTHANFLKTIFYKMNYVFRAKEKIAKTLHKKIVFVMLLLPHKAHCFSEVGTRRLLNCTSIQNYYYVMHLELLTV